MGSIIFHAERRAAFTGTIELPRYEPERDLWGMRIWAISFALDAGDYLLTTSGRTLIKHLHKTPPQGGDYAIYANCRVALRSAPTLAELPENGSVPPESCVLALDGLNIRDCIDHYANVHADAQKQISGGAYRVELWCAAGTDAWDVDGLGGMSDYNCGNTHQFNVLVLSL